MDEKTFTVTFKAVGPITRSTVGEGQPDPEEEALNDVLHWIWSWQLQVDRLRESTFSNPSGEIPLEYRKSSSRASYDEHMVAVVGWNLARALKRAEPYIQLNVFSAETIKALELLRHLYEHWDEQRPAFQLKDKPKERAAKYLADMFPEARPWTMVFADDWLLGGQVGIGELSEALLPVEQEVLKLEAERFRSQSSKSA
jgi:hypothetical protein